MEDILTEFSLEMRGNLAQSSLETKKSEEIFCSKRRKNVRRFSLQIRESYVWFL
jgi:hypothetical protein